jgi:TPR repeat protein
VALAALVSAGWARADMAAGWQAYADGDYARAADEWRPLAERGDRNAAFGLGVLAQVQNQQAAAAKWYRKAAERGLTSAQVLLGSMYAEGRGVEQDLVQAYAWLHLAAIDEHPSAAKARDAVGADLSPGQIARAEALSTTLRVR